MSNICIFPVSKKQYILVTRQCSKKKQSTLEIVDIGNSHILLFQ